MFSTETILRKPKLNLMIFCQLKLDNSSVMQESILKNIHIVTGISQKFDFLEKNTQIENIFFVENRFMLKAKRR
ncbi:hypothetical protein BpHYR1_012193 [Brachionus plicatilis]|uniref:Uncharacterized protein n=1 Tax=Brachionus plicatilis TaxID=10195 RepID=A0A3M7Q781_BRAPC|nr:hypothetical protein BpHYR1_012193 [Brachionus plicatilis]